MPDGAVRGLAHGIWATFCSSLLCGFACMAYPKSVLLHLENGVVIVANIDVSRRIQRGKMVTARVCGASLYPSR